MFNENYYFWAHNGTLAQLVQSACLTGKRSLVRFQYAPLILAAIKRCYVFCLWFILSQV